MRLGLILLAAAGALGAASIPSGTEIQIRLTAALNSATAQLNQRFDAVVIAPVVVGARIAMAAGAKVSGHILDVKAANQTDQQASLTLAFDQIADGARRLSLSAKVAAVDNARESVDANGQIVGIKASETASARLNQGINKVTEKYPGLGDILGAVKQAVVKDTDANIDYAPGVEMTIALTKPLDWAGVAAEPSVKAIQPEDALVRLVEIQPFRTVA